MRVRSTNTSWIGQKRKKLEITHHYCSYPQMCQGPITECEQMILSNDSSVEPAKKHDSCVALVLRPQPYLNGCQKTILVQKDLQMQDREGLLTFKYAVKRVAMSLKDRSDGCMLIHSMV